MKKFFISVIIASVTLGGFAQTTAKQWYEKGISIKKSEKFKDAINAFKKAVSLQATYTDALHQLGWCYNEEGMYNEALDAFRKEEKNNPSSKARTNFEIGFAYKGLKKYEDAIASFNKAIDMDKDYALAYKDRGACYFKLKDYEKALEDFNEYARMATDIKDEDFWYDKGWTENDLGKYSAAVTSLKNCIALDSKYADAYSELGYSYYELNLNNDALANYRIAVALDGGKDHHPLLGIADVYFNNLRNYDSAIVYYEKGLKLNEKHKSANYRLGWCYNDKSRFSEALQPLKNALLVDPGYDIARTELGYSYYKLEQYDNALSQFRPVMANVPKDELSRYYAGFCYYLKEDQASLKKMIAELKAINTESALEYVETLNKYIK